MRSNASFYRNLKRTFEDLLPWYCYAINTNTRKHSLPRLATPRSEHEWTANLPLHDTRTVNFAVVQCECHTGKYSGIAKIQSIDRNWATNFMFSRESWYLISIPKGKCPFPPCGRPWSEVMTTFFWKISAKCTSFEVSSLGLGLDFQVSSLGLEFQVSSLGLGVFDEVSVSSRNFNQVSVSKVTVSTTSL